MAERDGTSAWAARAAPRFLLPGGPRPALRRTGGQGSALGRGGGRAGFTVPECSRLAPLWAWFPIWEAVSGGPDAVVGRGRSRPRGW